MLAALVLVLLGLSVSGCSPNGRVEVPEPPPTPTLAEIDRLVDTADELQPDEPARCRILLEQALMLLAEEPDVVREARVRSRYSRVLMILGEITQAIEEGEAALALAKSTDAPSEIAEAACYLAIIHHRRADYERALELAELSRAAAERSGDDLALARAYNLMGVIYRNRGELAKALTNLLEALHLQEPFGNQERNASMLNNLGLVYWNMGNYDDAIASFEQALEIQRAMGNQRSEAFILNNIGLVLTDRGDLEEALGYLERSLAIKESIGDRASLASTFNNIGALYKELGRPQQALEYLERGAELFREIGDQRGIASSLISLSAISRMLGKHRRALAQARGALELATLIDAKMEISEANRMLAAISEDLGDTEQALEYYKAFHEMDRALIEPEQYKHILDLQTRFATRTQEREIARLRQIGEIAELKLERERLIRYGTLVALTLLLVLLVTVWSRSRLRNRMNSLLAEANQELRSSQDRYRHLFNDPTTPKAVVVLATRRISNANSGFAALCGHTQEELHGCEVGEVAPWLEAVISQRAADSSGSPAEQHVTCPDSNGGARDLEVWSSGLTLHEGPALLISIRDVTERRRLTEETERARKLEAVGVLAGGIAHDFNNAMAALLGLIGLARLDLDNPETANQTLVAAENAVLGTRELTSRLIAFSPGGAPRRVFCEIAPVVRDVVDGTYGGRIADVDLEIEDDLPQVKIDALQIRQVLRNILVNAVEAGGEDSEINVSVTQPDGGGAIRIEISDRGPGVPNELRSRVFEPFFTTKDGAAGLGLTAAYTIVLQHTGRLDHRPRQGGGTVFTIELPATATSQPAPSATSDESTGQRTRVLVVEDDPAVSHIFRRVLPEIGCEAEVVADGPTAIEEFRAAVERQQPFDLALVDLSLPGGLNGRDVFRELRTIDPGIIGVVASGYSNDPILANYQAAGFAAALSKPFTLAQLKAAISTAQIRRGS